MRSKTHRLREVSLFLSTIISYLRLVIVTASVTNYQPSKTFGSDLIHLHPSVDVFQHAGALSELKTLCAKVSIQIYIVLARPHLPSLREFASAVPAHKYISANRTPYELYSSHKA